MKFLSFHHGNPNPAPGGPRRARWMSLLALPLIGALGMLAPKSEAAPLRLDFTTNGGVTDAGWTPVTLAQALAGVTGVGGTSLNFSFANVGAYQGGDTNPPLIRAGFHNANNYVTQKVFTLSGLTPALPVKLYASAAWDGNNAGGYLVFGDTGPDGVKAQTVGNPGTAATIANLTYIGTAVADGTGTVTGELFGRYGTSTTGNAEGQLGAFVFLPSSTITATAGSNGTITPAGATSVPGGDTQNYTFTANSGYHVADVLVDGSSVGAVESYSFTNVVNDHSISVTFATNSASYTIAASAGANGSISPNGSVSAFAGTSKPFIITPAETYHVADVLVDGSSVGAVTSYTFSNVNANHSISATFAIDTFTLTATAGAGGTISPAGTSTVNSGGGLTYEITPDSGYYISTLLVDGVSAPVSAEYYDFFDVTANHTIAVTFDNRERLYLDFTTGAYSADWNPIYIPEFGDTNVDATDIGGTDYDFTIAHVGGYDNGNSAQSLTRSGFYNANGSASSHGFALKGVVPGRQVALYASAAWDGNPAGAYVVFGDSGAAGVKAQTVGNPGLYPSLANLTLIGTATADATGTVSGAMYGNVSVGGGGQGQLGGVVFVFGPIPVFTITASAGAHGTISPSGAVVVTGGETKTFTIAAGSGYHVADVLVDGASVGAVSEYTFESVIAAHSISASFAANTTTYTITASAGANGSINPSGAVAANQGVNKVFTITPAAGYHIADVIVDGASVGAVGSYTFTNITANHSIAASFAINTFTITASAGANGTITPSGATTADIHTDQTFSITAASGYFIDNVLVDGVPVGPVDSYTFTDVTANHSISATFDARIKLRLDLASNGTPTASGWTPVYANYLLNTEAASVADIRGMGYGFSAANVGSYDNGNTLQPLTRSGFYNFGQLANPHPFSLTGLNPGQSVTLYANAGWDGNARGGYIVFGDSGAAGIQAQTVGDPGIAPTLDNLTLIGTATADAGGTVTGILHGANGVDTASEGQIGGMIFAINAGGTPASPYATWATGFNLTGNDALPGSDPDHDSQSNLLEFALNGSPVSGSSRGRSVVRLATVGAESNVLTLTLATRSSATFTAAGNRMKSGVTDGVTYVVEAANTLADWGGPVVTEVTGADATAIQSTLPVPDAGWSYRTFRTDGNASNDAADFIRASVQ